MIYCKIASPFVVSLLHSSALCLTRRYSRSFNPTLFAALCLPPVNTITSLLDAEFSHARAQYVTYSQFQGMAPKFGKFQIVANSPLSTRYFLLFPRFLSGPLEPTRLDDEPILKGEKENYVQGERVKIGTVIMAVDDCP